MRLATTVLLFVLLPRTRFPRPNWTRSMCRSLCVCVCVCVFEPRVYREKPAKISGRSQVPSRISQSLHQVNFYSSGKQLRIETKATSSATLLVGAISQAPRGSSEVSRGCLEGQPNWLGFACAEYVRRFVAVLLGCRREESLVHRLENCAGVG